MPSSRVCTVPYIIGVIQRLKPKSILDVGIGFGKWGYLFREYTDIIAAEKCPKRYNKEGWSTQIDGIEGYSEYLYPAHYYIYNTIYEENAAELLSQLDDYDVIFLEI